MTLNNKIVIFSDPHITENSISELDDIFTEILSKSGKDVTLVMCGDYFHKSRFTYKEMLFGLDWAKVFVGHFKEVYFLEGNGLHEKVGEHSAIDYLTRIGVKVVEELELDSYFFGHYMVQESKLNYGKEVRSIKELSKYKGIFLGHQHSYQEDIHPGSCRYVSFGEVEDVGKYYFTIENDIITRHRIETCIDMFDATTIEELECFPALSKVRLRLSDFNYYKNNIEKINRLGKIFLEFKLETSFRLNNSNLEVSSKQIDTKESLLQWLEKESIDLEVKEYLKKCI